MARPGARRAAAAIGGRRVVIRLLVRRFLCGSAAYPAVTFAEQPQGLASRYARRTPLCGRVLSAAGLALAGRAGSRPVGVLAIGVSRDTLLRLVMAQPDPPGGPVPVRSARSASRCCGCTRRARSAAQSASSRPAWCRPACTAECWRWRSRSSRSPTPCGRCRSRRRSACRWWLHPIGASGLLRFAEAALQVMGRAGAHRARSRLRRLAVLLHVGVSSTPPYVIGCSEIRRWTLSRLAHGVGRTCRSGYQRCVRSRRSVLR